MGMHFGFVKCSLLCFAPTSLKKLIVQLPCQQSVLLSMLFNLKSVSHWIIFLGFGQLFVQAIFTSHICRLLVSCLIPFVSQWFSVLLNRISNSMCHLKTYVNLSVNHNIMKGSNKIKKLSPLCTDGETQFNTTTSDK